MTVQSSKGRYEIVRSSVRNLWDQLSEGSYVITDESIAAHYADLIGDVPRCFILPAGEGSKTLAVFGDCLRWLASQNASRGSVLVALGGGVIGDLVGFVADSYMRGISYTQVPTTLLAQVDSSVGGKVAIDLPEGKNLVGAFHPPSKVVLCSDFLKTLPERQIKNGLAEVIKYGFIEAPELLDRVQDLNLDVPEAVVDECVRIKASMVEVDEFETKGIRAKLNFGHTVGHAIETELCYRDLLHGEAVAIGMVVECRLGELLGLTEPGTATAVREAVESMGLPTSHPILAHKDSLIRAMYRDKKSMNGKLTFSLLEKIGSCKLIAGVSEQQVWASLAND